MQNYEKKSEVIRVMDFIFRTIIPELLLAIDTLMTTYVEGSLWKLKTSLTGTTWKKHWVVCDGTKLYQFKSKAKPPANEAPKYTLDVASSTVEYTNVRKFCFKINDSSNNLSLVLAADDFESYEKWLKATMKKQSQTIKEEKKNIVVENKEEIEQEPSVVSYEDKSAHVVPKPIDPIWDYFCTHNCSQVYFTYSTVSVNFFP